MDLEVFTLCQQAIVDENGLHIAGTIENIRAPRLPMVAPLIYAAVRLRFEPREAGPHMARFYIADQDGQQPFPPLHMDFQAKVYGSHPYGWAYLVQAFGRLTFERYDVFGCHFELDGEELAWVPFAVVKK